MKGIYLTLTLLHVLIQSSQTFPFPQSGQPQITLSSLTIIPSYQPTFHLLYNPLSSPEITNTVRIEFPWQIYATVTNSDPIQSFSASEVKVTASTLSADIPLLPPIEISYQSIPDVVLEANTSLTLEVSMLVTIVIRIPDIPSVGFQGFNLTTTTNETIRDLIYNQLLNNSAISNPDAENEIRFETLNYWVMWKWLRQIVRENCEFVLLEGTPVLDQIGPVQRMEISVLMFRAQLVVNKFLEIVGVTPAVDRYVAMYCPLPISPSNP